MKLHRFLLLVLIFFIICSLAQAADWMPDPYLRQAVREKLEIPDELPMFPADIASLTYLVVEHDIQRLKGLEYAINLEFLHIGRSEVSDLTPLAGLKSLTGLKLFANRIRDITPLAGLINLEVLELQDNQIEDISPLAGLVNLKRLNLGENQIVDISSLSNLTTLTHLHVSTNQIVDFTPLLNLINLESLGVLHNPNSGVGQFLSADPVIIDALRTTFCDFETPTYVRPVKERIESREYPSIFIGFHGEFGNIIDLAPFEQVLLTDLSFFGNPFIQLFSLGFHKTPLGMRRVGDITLAKQQHAAVLRENPNRISLVEIAYFDGRRFGFPKDSPYWFRNPDGTIARRIWYIDAEGNESTEPLVNFTLPEVQEIIIAQVLAVASCGLYDGIILDRWSRDLEDYISEDIEMATREKILQGIREAVKDDFLIVINGDVTWAPYVNGIFMERAAARDRGSLEFSGENYTRADFFEIENSILLNEANLREPSFIALSGSFPSYSDPQSPKNQQIMRIFTTLSLTHSDGYISMVQSGYGGIYYDFWDADLGRPIGEKAQTYENREGLFIREFTNGWAVYNRSGSEQQIEFAETVSGWSSGVKDKRRHTLADLDGEIYLKAETPPTADVNGDGTVNILDLVIVANAFGEAAPDLNGDGVVDVLDLVLVANSF